MKRRSNRSKKRANAFWRTDFRIVETLPDIKVVRTHFLINFAAIAILVAAGFTLAQREYTLRSLEHSMELLENRLRSGQSANREVLAWNKRFIESARGIEEVQLLYRAPFSHHQFLAELAMSRPAEMVFRQISYQEIAPPPAPRARAGGRSAPARITLPSYMIQLRGDVSELNILDQLKTLLEEFSYSTANYSVMVTESVQPRTDAGMFPFSIEIRLSPPS